MAAFIGYVRSISVFCPRHHDWHDSTSKDMRILHLRRENWGVSVIPPAALGVDLECTHLLCAWLVR